MSASTGDLMACSIFSRLQRFHFGGAGLDRVDLEAAAARFHQRALQDAFGAGAPGLQLDAVFLLEASADHLHVVDRDRRIDIDDAFLLGASDQPRGAVGTAIGGELGQRRRRLREGGRREQAGECKRNRAAMKQADRHQQSPHDMQRVCPHRCRKDEPARVRWQARQIRCRRCPRHREIGAPTKQIRRRSGTGAGWQKTMLRRSAGLGQRRQVGQLLRVGLIHARGQRRAWRVRRRTSCARTALSSA